MKPWAPYVRTLADDAAYARSMARLCRERGAGVLARAFAFGAECLEANPWLHSNHALGCTKSNAQACTCGAEAA